MRGSMRSTPSVAALLSLVALLTCGALLAPAPLCRAEGPTADEKLYRDNVVIVLDASGSMKQRMQRAPGATRMEAAKQALKQVVSTLPETTHVGLVVFSAANLRDPWVFPLGPIDRERLRAAIDLPQPEHGTPLGAYMKIGTDALLKQRTAQKGYGTFRLLVVTDGEATDPDVLAAYLPDVLSRGITLDAIGVDMAQEHALATKVHSYRRADSPEQLAQAVAAVFGEVGANQDDAVASEEFAAIAAIPAEMAGGMLEGLTRFDDRPIGTASAAGVAGAPVGGSPQGAPPASAPHTVPAAEKKSNWMIWMIVVLVIVFSVMRRAISNSAKGRARR